VSNEERLVAGPGSAAGLGESFHGILMAAGFGEEWAWCALYAELSPRVRGYLRAQGEADPDDLAGEVFVQVVRDLARFEGGEVQFRAWVMTIAHHRLVDERRRRARRPVVTASPVEAHEEIGGDVEEEAIAMIGEQRIQEALAGLSDQQRAVLLLRVLGDLTVEQVARVIGKRPGAVKALQRRGLEVLKREMELGGVTV
jgi:RNA polymerase sigma factor (sigma-70 family)